MQEIALCVMMCEGREVMVALINHLCIIFRRLLSFILRPPVLPA